MLSNSIEVPMKVEYVCGFAINRTMRRVLLVRNESNKLDGIRGQVMPGETPAEAMLEAFASVTGLRHSEWGELAVMEGNDCRTYYMQASRYDLFGSKGDVMVVPICDAWQWPVAPNLRWLLGMAMDESLHMPIRVKEKA